MASLGQQIACAFWSVRRGYGSRKIAVSTRSVRGRVFVSPRRRSPDTERALNSMRPCSKIAFTSVTIALRSGGLVLRCCVRRQITETASATKKSSMTGVSPASFRLCTTTGSAAWCHRRCDPAAVLCAIQIPGSGSQSPPRTPQLSPGCPTFFDPICRSRASNPLSARRVPKFARLHVPQ